MTKIVKFCLLSLFVVSGALCGSQAQATVYNAASCNTAAVQTAINSASRGDTVQIPAGTCTWTTGVTISGKGITVQGAGSGRIVAYDNGSETLTVGTGSLTVNVAGFSPGFNAAVFATGTTLRVFENNARTNWMQGTVTSFSGSTLVMNITSSGGSGTTHRWLIATIPSTVLINNSTTAMFSVTEDSVGNTRVGGFKIAAGTGAGDGIDFISGGGQAIVFHDAWVEQVYASGDSVHTSINRGLVYNVSFDSSPFSMSQLAIHLQPFDATAWMTTSFFGMNDTNGLHNFYVENCDFHAYLNATDNDEGARSVFRYSLWDNAAMGTHGADTGPFGSRYFEFYNNTNVFNGYSDGTTFSMNWWFFIRGGTFVIHDNTIPALTSQDYPNKADLNMTVMNLQRNSGPNPCWGAGTTGGADYRAPHQVGLGNVTGTALDGMGLSTYSPGSGYAAQYAGDSEPGYAWANSRQPLTNIGVSDYGPGNTDSCPSSPAPDTSSNYIIANRDYFNGTTPKPGYTPYTYPHPLAQAASANNSVNPPGSVSGVGH
jgi:hypothetical protein